METNEKIGNPEGISNSGWRKYMLMWDWHDVQLSGYKGWDLETPKPPHIILKFTRNIDKEVSSRVLAQIFDDISQDRFYYRDFTEDTLPFCNEGEKYRSCFWFKKWADYHKFKDLLEKHLSDVSLEEWERLY